MLDFGGRKEEDLEAHRILQNLPGKVQQRTCGGSIMLCAFRKNWPVPNGHWRQCHGSCRSTGAAGCAEDQKTHGGLAPEVQ